RSFAYVNKLNEYEFNPPDLSFDTIVSHINLYDPNNGTSQVLLTIKELNTGPDLSLGLTEVVPLPDGEQLFVAYRPENLEDSSMESRSGFMMDIPRTAIIENRRNTSILDLTNGASLHVGVKPCVYNLPFGYKNSGVWIPSPSGESLAWIVHNNPKDLETDLRRTKYTLYLYCGKRQNKLIKVL